MTSNHEKVNLILWSSDFRLCSAHNFPVPEILKDLSSKFDEYAAQEYLLTGTHKHSTLTKDAFVKATVGCMLNLLKENFDRMKKTL